MGIILKYIIIRAIDMPQFGKFYGLPHLWPKNNTRWVQILLGSFTIYRNSIKITKHINRKKCYETTDLQSFFL